MWYFIVSEPTERAQQLDFRVSPLLGALPKLTFRCVYNPHQVRNVYGFISWRYEKDYTIRRQRAGIVRWFVIHTLLPLENLWIEQSLC